MNWTEINPALVREPLPPSIPYLPLTTEVFALAETLTGDRNFLRRVS